MFNRSEVIVLTNKNTNKQTPLKTSNGLRYATTLGSNSTVKHIPPGQKTAYWRVHKL